MGKAPERDGKHVSPDTTLVVTDSQIVPASSPPPTPRIRETEVSMWAGAVVLSDEFQPKRKSEPRRRRRWPWIAGGIAIAASIALGASLTHWGPWYSLEDASTVIVPPEPAAAPAPQEAPAVKKKKKPPVKPRR